MERVRPKANSTSGDTRGAGTGGRPGHDAELLDLLLEASIDGVVDHDLEAQTVRYSSRWKLLLGFEPHDLVESPRLWRDLSHPDDLPQVMQLLRDHMNSFWAFNHTWRMRHASGEWRSMSCRVVTARDAFGKPRRMVGIFSDVTDQVRAAERQRALISAIPDLLLRIGADGTVLDRKLPDRSHGVSEAEFVRVGAPLASWPACVAWYPKVLRALHEEHELGVATVFEAPLVLSRATHLVEVRVSRSTGDEVVCIVRDITDTRRLQEERMQASKLESVGQLAAGIAHEINTPLQYIGDNLAFLGSAFASVREVVSAQAQLIAKHGAALPADAVAAIAQQSEAADVEFLLEEGPRAVSAALDGSRQVARIVSAMKEFSHPGQFHTEMYDLNHAVECTATISKNVWKYVADLELALSPELPRVPCHAGEINQVLLNLIVNAAHAIGDAVGDATRGRGKICIATSAGERYAEIRVSDTGTGIPEAVRPRIFDPFFTTKEVGRGTGQGLSIARATVVDKHGGTLTFETEVGKGTTFVMRLPLQRASKAASSSVSTP
jgi:PAS domain S-box-containing protein